MFQADEKSIAADSTASKRGTENVLFVDDEEALAKLGKKMLEQLGYHVTLETMAHKALETFRANPEAIDIIITDQTMPGMTGGRLAKEVMDIRPDVPVIICTGYSDIMSEKKAYDLGVRSILMKPFDRSSLSEAVRRILDGTE